MRSDGVNLEVGFPIGELGCLVSVVEVAIRPLAGSSDYRVDVVRSPAGEASATVRLDVPELLARRAEIERLVLASARRSSVPAEAERPLRDIGNLLFSALLGSGDVAGRYQASTALAVERADGLRVVLTVDDPALAALPWEAMYDKAIGGYLCRRHQLVRSVPVGSMPGPLAVRLPLRILAVIASPAGLPSLNVEKEKEQLSDALSALRNNGLVEIHFAAAATWVSLQQLLLSREWHVVHFVGHGAFDVNRNEGVLILVGDDGEAHHVDAASLVDLMRQARPMPRLVVLNSCSGAAAGVQDLYSGTAAALVRGGVTAVAAMQFAISDGAAIAFGRGFYTAIAHGRGIDDATSSGRVAILGTGRGTLEWVTPVIYVRGHDDSRLFALRTGEEPGVAEPDLRDAVLTDRWDHIADNAMLAAALLASSTASKSVPSVCIGIISPIGDLGSELSTSQLRSDFLRFLDQSPVSGFLRELRLAAVGSRWASRAGDGRIELEAGYAQTATATLLLPQANATVQHGAVRYARFVLQVELGNSDRGVAHASLPDWHQRLAIALSVPGALADFLRQTLRMRTERDPAVQFGIRLNAHNSIGELVDTHGLTALPGARVKNGFETYATSSERGKTASETAVDFLVELCERTLHLQGYEPLLAVPRQGDGLPRGDGQAGSAQRQEKLVASGGQDSWEILATDRGIVGIQDGLMILEWALNRAPDPEWLQFLVSSGVPKPPSLTGTSRQPRIYGTRLQYPVPESDLDSAVNWVETSIPLANMSFQAHVLAIRRAQASGDQAPQQ